MNSQAENRARDVKAIFLEALEKLAGPQRTSYLDETCGSNVKLRREVESLLFADQKAGEFLDPAAFSTSIEPDQSPLTEGPGTVIGRYKLLERIGEGGMAVVYMAEQEQPIRRKVALKIIKLGMDTRQVIARFEAERQALALMDHPNIAKVHDAGATETGRPYFVMELVHGVSITDYCDQNSLDTLRRLELFVQVCRAVQHAHQKGIIHRDIKPSNVMVTQRDGVPVPKVIDFGIAKATNQKLTEKTLFTRYAHIIGTPAYMSPEQAELSDLDIDTRSDIYSLGVLLYELLTGTTPFSEEELRKAGYIEMQRVIREQEPVKPSTKLSTLGETFTDVAKRRSSTPDLLRKAIRGDLDWIVMKSLEKDRARRYETPNGLAEDIRRHLEHEPVFARGPSTGYRVQKFLRRHRVRTLAVLAMAVLAGAVVVVFSMWNRDRLQLVEAEGFRHRGILSQAREQYAAADREAALEAVKSILDSKHVGPEAQLLYAGILVDGRQSAEALTMLQKLLNDRPEIAGVAHSLLARVLWESESLDAEKLEEIDAHRRKAEALLPETAEAYFLRAMTAVTVKEQLASLDRALQLDPAHYESRRLRAFTYYASRKYDRLRDDALAMTILRPREALGYSLRAVAWRELGRYPEAIADYDMAIVLTAREDPHYIDLCAQRGETLLRMGDYRRVMAEARDYLKLWPDSLVFHCHILCAQTTLGDYENASALFRRVISAGQDSQRQFQRSCMKYVFDTLEAGRPWHALDGEPVGAAFLPMVEAEETYRDLSAKARRVTTHGFSAHWSPDGTKLVFSLGVRGYSGVAIFDPATQETELLIVPGKHPRWSPDGRHIAFVRDRQVLRVPELVGPERSNQPLRALDEEVWVMKSDGTEPRRLARGGWPSWGRDSTCVYYHSHLDHTFYSISVEGRNAEPKRITGCSGYFPSMSPDARRVAYLAADLSLKVEDLDSQTLVAEWPAPLPSGTWGGPAWSPAGDELCMGGGGGLESRTGLWVYRLDGSEPAKTLGGQVTAGSWAPDGTKLVFEVGAPYFEIWAADLDPNLSTIEALGPARTMDEHFREMVALCTRRIEADPADADSYLRRARQYQDLHEAAEVRADMRRHQAILNQGFSSDFRLGGPWTFMSAVNGPFGYQLVVFVERQEDGMYVLRIAFGQKGRCQMKPLAIPMVVMSLVGLCFLSGVDTPTAHADFTFGEPTNLGPPINSVGSDHSACPSADGLELYFTRGDVAGRIWVTQRATPDAEWGPPSDLGPPVNSPDFDGGPSISADGLSLYFFSDRPGGSGLGDTWVTTRATVDDNWRTPVNLGPPVNTTSDEYAPCISADGLELYFTSDRPGGSGNGDLWVASRTTTAENWGAPVNLGPTLNTSAQENWPGISADGLLLFFGSSRPGGVGSWDLYMARRATRKGPWGPPINLGPTVNSTFWEVGGKVSADGSTLYFQSPRSGGVGAADIWQVSISPVVDFSGDGKVDGKDVLTIAKHWGQAEPAVDIGPTPLGDGIVDVQDLTVLAEYIGAEIDDPTLVAHWPLDEADGMIVSDHAGDHHGTVIGLPVWQPAAGQVGGALQLDGAAFVAADSVLSPADGPFSVLAWVKGGAPGEGIIAQQGGVNWLMADAATGALMTELSKGGRTGTELRSQAIVTDGEWHRVALTWDGVNRRLYVDDALAAEDVQAGLADSTGGLILGAGGTMAPGTLLAGLIDDVRIYNRAVQP